MTDVIVIGGGVIGLSIAYELAGQGATVSVLEKGQLGREASWAGAGMLPPGHPGFALSPESQLRSESAVRWPIWSEQLRDETGIDNGYRRSGGLTVRLNGAADELAAEAATWREGNVSVEALTLPELFASEPNLSREITSAFRLPELAQIRNPRHLKALISACIARGVTFFTGEAVTGFDINNGSVSAVRTVNGLRTAGHFCVAGGAWSRCLLESIDSKNVDSGSVDSGSVDSGDDILKSCGVDVTPVRGQIVLLSANPHCFRHVIEVGTRYLVPRPDGRVLVGATEETVGFDKRNTAEAVAGLIDFATSLVPALKDASFERAWAGLRPRTSAELPFLSHIPGIENLTIAAGHFRSGLQMSPATAVFMRQLILGQDLLFAAEPFAVGR